MSSITAMLSAEACPTCCGRSTRRSAALTLDSASGNPFQPTLYYRGLAASPLQRRPQGLAVYVNGMRFNQSFGDTVDWGLIPNNAIDRLDVEGSDPVFGLNALGGSINVQMKERLHLARRRAQPVWRIARAKAGRVPMGLSKRVAVRLPGRHGAAPGRQARLGVVGPADRGADRDPGALAALRAAFACAARRMGSI